MPKNIAIVFDDSMDRNDGVQQYIRAVAKGLSARGHSVEVWCSDSQASTIDGSDIRIRSLSKNISVKGNGNHLTMPARARMKAVRVAFEEFKPDVIHVQAPYSPLLAGRVINQAKKRGVRVVGSFHIHAEDRLFVIGNKILAKLQRGTLKKFDAMCAVSPAAQDYCRSVYGIETEVIPNTVDLDFDHDYAPQTVTEKPYILFLGRLEERKGPHLLLDALPRVLQELPDVDVIFAGGGPLQEKLEAEAAPLAARVKFIGRFEEDAKAGLLAGAELAVYPSFKGESFGIVLIEAFMANHPLVLAGKNDGYDYVMEPMPEQSVDPHETESLAQKIITLYKLRNAAKALIRRKQLDRLQDFTISAVVPQIERLYES